MRTAHQIIASEHRGYLGCHQDLGCVTFSYKPYSKDKRVCLQQIFAIHIVFYVDSLNSLSLFASYHKEWVCLEEYPNKITHSEALYLVLLAVCLSTEITGRRMYELRIFLYYSRGTL